MFPSTTTSLLVGCLLLAQGGLAYVSPAQVAADSVSGPAVVAHVPHAHTHAHGGSLSSRRSRQRAHLRHVRRAPSSPAVVGGLAALAPRDACTYGDWGCNGNSLTRCYDGAMHVMRDCGSKLVCSTDAERTGCIWPFQAASPSYVGVDDEDNANVTMASAGATVAASSVVLPSATMTGAVTASVTDGGAVAAASVSVSASASSDSAAASPTDDAVLASSSDAPSSSLIAGALYGAGGHKSAIQPTGSSTSSAWWVASSSSSSADAWETASASSSADWNAPSSSSSADAWDATASASSTTDWNATPTSTRRKHKSSSTAWATASASASSTSVPVSSGSGVAFKHSVIYSDSWLTQMPSVADLQGYNHFLLAFWMSNSGAVDNVQFWSQLGSAQQQAILSEYNAAGITLMISAFGSTDNPVSWGVDPVQCAQDLAAFVKANHLNGVDIDLEDNAAFNAGFAEAWAVKFQLELRRQLPAPYIISHAPQAPWFTTSGQYTGGGYLTIDEQAGSGIDFYNIQFYNQGQIYEDCDSLLHNSGGGFPGTSLFEIAERVDPSKLVIGKPLSAGAAANGYMSTSTLASCIQQAKSKNWDAGVMYWEYASDAIQVMAAIAV